MNLIHYRGGAPNFGDDLNRELWPRLAPELFLDDGASDEGFVGIGTCIGMATGLRRLNVFSTGVGNDPIANWADLDVNYWCVRGPISGKILGLPPEKVITDGAFLVPLVDSFPKAASARPTGVVVIPHFQSIPFDGWDRACDLAGFELLDPRGTPQEVIKRIASAELVLTESLHGAILAEIYGVPWHAFAPSKHFGVAKWIDWLASLDRDFELTLIPAPDPRLVLAFGRRSEPLGSLVTFNVEQGAEEFDARVVHGKPPAPWKRLIKQAAVRVPFADRLLGFTPERTAEALLNLSRREPNLSPRSVITQHQARMMETLSQLKRAKTV